MTNTEVTRLPHRLEPFRDANGRAMRGWTVREFPNSAAAAEWFAANRDAEMPCWRRMEIVNGRLLVVR